MHDKYSDAEFISHIHTELPLEEFIQGKFSKAGEIVQKYNALLSKMLAQFQGSYIETTTMKEYRSRELTSLQEKKKKAEGELAVIQSTIKKITELGNALRQESDKSGNWEVIWGKLKELEFSPQEFEYFWRYFEKNNGENYRQGEKQILAFLASPKYQELKTYTEEHGSLSLLKRKRRDIVRKLSHKGNTHSVEQQIKDIESGKAEAIIESSVRDDIQKYFWKKDRFEIYRAEDTREMFDIYMEVVVAKIIVHKKVNKRLRQELIKRFHDKLGLWKYVRDDYQYLIKRGHVSIDQVEAVVGLISDEEEKQIKAVIEEIKYWVNFSQKKRLSMRRSFGDADMQYIEDKLSGKPNYLWAIARKGDDTLSDLFEFLTDHLEDSSLEDAYGKLRDYKYLGMSLDKNQKKEILTEIFTYMSGEERKDTLASFGSWAALSDIEEAFLSQTNQLDMFLSPQ